MDRPIWCEDENCSPLSQMPTLGGGQCIGKLFMPTDHINKAVNTMSRCHYDRAIKSVNSFNINHEDIIVETYLNGEALRILNLSLPKSIVDNLPKGE